MGRAEPPKAIPPLSDRHDSNRRKPLREFRPASYALRPISRQHERRCRAHEDRPTLFGSHDAFAFVGAARAAMPSLFVGAAGAAKLLDLVGGASAPMHPLLWESREAPGSCGRGFSPDALAPVGAAEAAMLLIFYRRSAANPDEPPPPTHSLHEHHLAPLQKDAADRTTDDRLSDINPRIRRTQHRSL